MKLTILVCSLQKRLTLFANLCEHLQTQADKYPNQVELLWLGDNKTMSVGEKRNKLLSLAKGDYVCFVDDDDWVPDNYVVEIMKGIEQKPDCVCFNAIYTADGTSVAVEYSLQNLLNVDEPGKPRLRVPNHLIPIKREYALKTMFLEKSFGEDTDYGLRVRRLLKTEYRIEKPLYHYRFSAATSETHRYSPKYKKPKPSPMIKMDVVMVSDAGLQPAAPLNTPIGGEQEVIVPSQGSLHNGEGWGGAVMTQAAINSIASPEVNVIVLEKSEQIRYANADTYLQRHPFNYNQCLNNGATMGNAELICFTNNDVVFPDEFLHSVLQIIKDTGADVLSFANQHGFLHPEIISGFCFVITRKAYYKIGKLKQDYLFWCADNVTSEQIKQHGLKEVKSPLRVTHLTSVTLKKLPADLREAYTRDCVKAFNRDYNQNVLNLGK